MTRERDQAMEKLRERVAGQHGPRYWRALEELVEDPELRRQLNEALPQLSALNPALDRRGFLRLLGASLALAGLSGCSGPPPQAIVPWIRQPEGMPQSLPQFYATTLHRGGNVAGVLVETHNGRPTKIEGNPVHPMSLGGSDALQQASVLELWDPDRSQTPMRDGVVATWAEFSQEAALAVQRFGSDGAGLHVLTGEIASPTLAAQRDALLQRFPGARWYRFSPVDDDNAREGARRAFGAPLRTRLHLDRAAVIVALDADVLGDMPGHLRHARDWAAGRQPDGAAPRLNRLYAIEPSPSLTGAKADHSWPLAHAHIEAFVRELATELGVFGDAAPAPDIPVPAPESAQAIPRRSGIDSRRTAALGRDLREHRGASLLVAGRAQPPSVHALVHRINASLGNLGATVEAFAWPEAQSHDQGSLAELTQAMSAGQVDTLLLLDVNPVYAAPADMPFAQALTQVEHSVHVGLYRDETALACRWHLPATHALEAWSDLRAADGTASIVQPVISPLYAGRSLHEVLALFDPGPGSEGRDIVRATWSDTLDDPSWQTALRTGVIAGSAPEATDALVADASGLAASHVQDAGSGDDDAVELLFRPDPTVWDGRYANSGWLQELPKPLSLLTWGNAALVSPALAAEHALSNGDLVRLDALDRSLEVPVWILPGQVARCVTLPLGYGRAEAGRVGDALGFNACKLRSLASPWCIQGATLRATGARREMAATQQHHAMLGRAPVRAMTLAQLLANAEADAGRGAGGEVTAPVAPGRPSLYPPRENVAAAADPQWGMSVNLDTCIGCGACTASCQAENNIPVVGEEEVRRGREMHWIRVDRYYEGEPDTPLTLHQPVPCMHCEHAPCEVVCPVGATVHDSQGLNLQVYNRCVGTRFCSNNCPYKVRRFNFLQYADVETESLKSLYNPDVTVRNRGVMEKCTYCIQRIQTAKISADREGRTITDGEVVTACQAACPTRAITFGDIGDPDSAVSREKGSGRNYTLLEELNTRPRTTYLAAVRNRNPALDEAP